MSKVPPLSRYTNKDLLRFLTTEAKIPLTTAMTYTKSLAAAKLKRYPTPYTPANAKCKSHSGFEEGGIRCACF